MDSTTLWPDSTLCASMISQALHTFFVCIAHYLWESYAVNKYRSSRNQNGREDGQSDGREDG